jgi:hypothetical protein
MASVKKAPRRTAEGVPARPSRLLLGAQNGDDLARRLISLTTEPRNPWGDCIECGAPATLDHDDAPLGVCNGCREDGWYRCSHCGESYRKDGLGGLGYVKTVEHGDEVWNCHPCARERFLLLSKAAKAS